ncbi:hypothetical protein Avbf_05358 [Armadillidium vulgare]|nr:hypothetical protein Avbf_05358 [Armadillidium vulgare]
MLRERAIRSSSNSAEEAVLREQLRMLQMQLEKEKREWEIKLRKDIDEKEEEKRNVMDEKLELMRKLRATQEEYDEEKESLEGRIRESPLIPTKHRSIDNIIL